MLLTALTHRSYAHEHGISSNERLEFLGDAVLQLVVTRHLFNKFSHLKEGQMTRVRAAVVRKEALVVVAEALGVGDALLLGRGEAGWQKAGILGDAMEALIGAVFVDGGWKAAETLVLRHWEGMISEQAAHPDARDPKTELQERLASDGIPPAEYRMQGKGPAHARRFQVEIRVAGRLRGVGKGSSRRLAEQQAAVSALGDLYPKENLPLTPAPSVPVSEVSGPSPILDRIRRWRHRRPGPKI